uniref:non-specific serine/threonine protein kinase n=1 Tax=Acrobeloides nanus TaxID=290746 RepID=A0A914CMP9_9BILA
MVPLDCRSQEEKNAIKSEADLLSKLAHPNIIALYDAFISDDCFHMVMQYAEGGTMEQLIKDQRGLPMSQDTVLYYFTQVTIALDYIHSKKILHRDLKTQNILLNRKRTIVKLGDFGISKQMLTTGRMLSTMIGTPNYLSPEICEGRKYDGKSDIWSLGCVLFELVELRRAFDGESFASIVRKITTGNHAGISKRVSPEMIELINAILSIREASRPNTKEILTHPLVLPKCIELHLDLGRIEAPMIPLCRRSSSIGNKETAQTLTGRYSTITTETLK